MNREEFEIFLKAYGGDILSFCRYLTGNKEDAEDLCQDVFVRGYELMDSDITEDIDAKKLFLRYAVRLWKDRKRKFARRRRLEEEKYFPIVCNEIQIAEEANSPEEEFFREEETQFVRECVDHLSDKKKIVVMLYYMENMKESEIAEILHIPIGTVKSRLHQAKHELVEMLSNRLG